MIRQFSQDIHIWSHQRYSDPPALASSEYEGFTAIRKWAMKFYPDGKGGSAAELAAAQHQMTTAERHSMSHQSGCSRSPPATSAPR